MGTVQNGIFTKALHLPHAVYSSLATIDTEERRENCNHVRPHKDTEEKIHSSCTSSPPADLLLVRDAHKSVSYITS